MYLHLGSSVVIHQDDILGIFDLDNSSWSKHTRNFLTQAEKEGNVISVCEDIPKSFILTREMGMDRVYLTQFSASTIEKRLTKKGRKTSTGNLTVQNILVF